MTPNIIAQQRLYLTADKTELVGEGDERAAFLFANTGDEIVAEEHERFGLIDGALPGFEADAPADEEAADEPAVAAEPETKPAAAAETKPAKTAKTKA